MHGILKMHLKITLNTVEVNKPSFCPGVDVACQSHSEGTSGLKTQNRSIGQSLKTISVNELFPTARQLSLRALKISV